MVKHWRPPPDFSDDDRTLSYGKLVGYFKEERQKSYESCSNKKISFDLPLADAIDHGQVFVILKRVHSGGELALREDPQIKIYGDHNEGKFHWHLIIHSTCTF